MLLCKITTKENDIERENYYFSFFLSSSLSSLSKISTLPPCVS